MTNPTTYVSRNIRAMATAPGPGCPGEWCTLRAYGVTGYLNSIQRCSGDVSEALLQDTHAILALKTETRYQADVVIEWAHRLLPLVRPLLKDNSVIVCVPPSSTRGHLAGIQLVALAVAVCLEVEFAFDGLQRVNPVPISVERDRRDRSTHRASIAVDPGIAGKHVILLDDVLVSGTTLGVCAELLVGVGAASVAGVTLAHSCEGYA